MRHFIALHLLSVLVQPRQRPANCDPETLLIAAETGGSQRLLCNVFDLVTSFDCMLDYVTSMTPAGYLRARHAALALLAARSLNPHHEAHFIDDHVSNYVITSVRPALTTSEQNELIGSLISWYNSTYDLPF